MQRNATIRVRILMNSTVFKNNWPTLASFIIYFWSFQTNIITNFTTNWCEKNSIQYMVPGLEPMTSWHDYPPITTRPGLPQFLFGKIFKKRNIRKRGRGWPIFIATWWQIKMKNSVHQTAADMNTMVNFVSEMKNVWNDYSKHFCRFKKASNVLNKKWKEFSSQIW